MLSAAVYLQSRCVFMCVRVRVHVPGFEHCQCIKERTARTPLHPAAAAVIPDDSALPCGSIIAGERGSAIGISNEALNERQ